MDAYHVLVVDDQRDIRRVLSGGLQTLGQNIKVTEVPSAEEAMLLAPRQGFDLIVTDVRLPGMSGLELVKRLRKFSPNLKIILLTGASDFQTRKQVEEAGTFAFFYKPIELSDFLDAVERALGLVATTFTPPPLSMEPLKKAEGFYQAKTEPVQIKPVPQAVEHAPSNPLADLLSRIDSLAAYCLDMDGSMILQAGGQIEYAVENAIVTAGLRVMRSNTSLSHALGKTDPEYLLFIDGSRYNLCLAPVGRKHILLVLAGQSLRDRAGSVETHVRAAAAEMVNYLNPPQIAPKPIPPVKPEPVAFTPPPEVTPAVQPSPEDTFLASLASVSVTDADREAIDQLFSFGTEVKQEVGNLDAFWDNVAEETGSLKQNESHLTYEQARQMGLAPES